jgi:hypothetical protein
MLCLFSAAMICWLDFEIEYLICLNDLCLYQNSESGADFIQLASELCVNNLLTSDCNI